jgi:hypothetical protein
MTSRSIDVGFEAEVFPVQSCRIVIDAKDMVMAGIFCLLSYCRSLYPPASGLTLT